VSVTAVVNAGAGMGAADHGGFPVQRGAPPATIEQLWTWACHWHARAPMLLANLDPSSAIVPIASEQLTDVGGERCPAAAISPGATFEEIRGGWTKNRRKTIGKKLQAFEAQGGRFEWTDDPDAVTRLLPTVFDLHRLRRNHLGKDTRFGHDVASRAFHERLARESIPGRGCWVQLAIVHMQPVGALYGFQLAGTYSVYQSGWDPRLHDSSVGLIQYAEAYRRGVERRGKRFDMCRGDDPYKLRFATEVAVERSYVRSNGVAGKLLGQRYRADDRRRQRRTRRSSGDVLVDGA
jgi:CelD/BcsL family acetyltransferase involved in cellulose biosynthesis